jgi:hypothetical protein
MPITILGAVFGLTLFSLIPIGIVALLRSKRATYSPSDFWRAVTGFAVFSIGLVALFWAVWSMTGGGHISMHSYLRGSGLLLIAALIIAGAMHILVLPKLFAIGFFGVPMLGYLIELQTKFRGPMLFVVMWLAILVVLPLLIAAYWVRREVQADA